MINKIRLILLVGFIFTNTVVAKDTNISKAEVVVKDTNISKEVNASKESNTTAKVNTKSTKIPQTPVEKELSSTMLMSNIADKFLKLEEEKNKNNMSVDGKILTKEEKAKLKAEVDVSLDKSHHKQMQSKFNLQKSFPLAIGYYKINNKRYATVDYHGKKFNIQKNNYIGGFKLMQINNNRLKFLTPSGKIIYSYYETTMKRSRKK